MADNSKNLYKFTEEEREEIEDILVRIVKEIQKSLDKHSNPKEYAKKVLKDFESNITIVATCLMLISINMKDDEKFSPKELRKRLPDEMQIKPRQLTEALYRAKKEGYLSKVERSKQVKRPGRHKASENISYTRGGGRPSSYEITEGLAKLKKFMSKSQANKLIHNRLKKSGIIQEYYKNIILTGYYAMRAEDKTKGKLFEFLQTAAPYYGPLMAESTFFSSWDNYMAIIFSLDETQLDLFAGEVASILVEKNLLEVFIYFLKALPKS
jgi:hypothetical protein